MSVSEKLTTIAENVDRVFTAGRYLGTGEGVEIGYQDGYRRGKDDGHAEGYGDGYQIGLNEGHAAGVTEGYKDGFDKGYAAGGSEGYQTGHAEGVTAGIKQGKQTEHDRWWDGYLDRGNRTNFDGAFSLYGWTDETFEPNRSMKVNSANAMFRYSQVTDLVSKLRSLGISMDFSDCTMYNQFAQYSESTTFPTIDMGKATNTNYAFASGAKVVTIEKMIFSENTVISASIFNNAKYLVHITFEGTIAASLDIHWSHLSRDSFISLASVLSPTATATLTVSKSAVSAAFPNRAEWDALFTNKPNWTISEV